MIEMGPVQVWMAEGGVPPKEIDNAMTWAFGEGWRFMLSANDLRIKWNEKHKDIFGEVGQDKKLSIFFWCVGKAYMEANFDHGKKSTFTQAVKKRDRRIFSIPGLIRGLGKGGF